MKSFRRVATYKHGIEDVWTALTDPYALAEWLMPTTFSEPKVGSKFRFQYDPERLCPSGIVDCEVIEVEPPRRLAWSWQNRAVEGATQPPPMRVEWTLTPVEGGTRVGSSNPTRTSRGRSPSRWAWAGASTCAGSSPRR
ncbi:MAG: hypothetical protein QOD42_1462 [Sphingomonadales bacterium]|jgi:uncharacterized protein YndB with AHSA1/START domain|nr:hypothetical protein [Sphingomonadales bacterium]